MARTEYLRKFQRDRLLLFTVISLLLWGSWAMLRTPCHPSVDLSCGIYTDHASHMNTARLFTRVGVRIWTDPLLEAAPQVGPEQYAALPEDLRRAFTPNEGTAVAAIPGWPSDKPFASSWANYPRFHPPGNMVVTAPVAVLYSYTGLSFTDANRLLILLFIIYAHLAFFVFVRGGDLKSHLKPVGFAAAAIVYLELIHWSLEGFYEGIVVVPLVLSARFLAQRRGVEALLAFSVAAVLHFRALFFAPWALYALYLIIRDRAWQKWSRAQWIQAFAAAILSAICIGIFLLIWPYLHTLNVYNSVTLAADPLNLPAIKTFIVVMVILACVLAYTRAWLDVGILVWVAIMLLTMRQAYEWETVSFFAWLGAPIIAAHRTQLVREVRLVALLFVATFVFHNSLVPGWFQRVLS